LGGDRPYQTDQAPQPIPVTRIRIPHDLLAIGDSMISKFGISGYLLATDDTLRNEKQRHATGINFVFVDGHVESSSQAELGARTPEARRRWNNDNLPHPETWEPAPPEEAE